MPAVKNKKIILRSKHSKFDAAQLWGMGVCTVVNVVFADSEVGSQYLFRLRKVS